MGKVREPTENDSIIYFTQRSVYAKGDTRKDNWGETEHKAKVWIFKDAPTRTNYDYSCPYCGHKDSGQAENIEPFEFACDKCGKIIKVPKLDKRLGKKKEKKEKKAKKEE